MTAAIILAVAYLLLFRGSTPKPWSPPNSGTRRQHRAAYGQERFKI